MFCRNCGKELAGAPEICLSCGAKPMVGTGFCPGCGATTTSLTEICTKCGVRIAKAVKKQTGKVTAAGVLSIIAGVIGIIRGIVFAVLGGIIGDIIGTILGIEWAWLGFFGAPSIVSGIIAIVGGIYALRRRVWGLALAGSIFAIWADPLWILGILAVIFVSLGKGEFE